MSYEDICRKVQSEIFYYEHKFGKKPNCIVLGETIYNTVKYGTSVVARGRDIPLDLFGIPITEDHQRREVILVGYMSELNN
jgi:hypothetical protein